MSDELIYRVKFVADDKSLKEVQDKLDTVKSEVSASRGNKGLRDNERAVRDTEREISALKQLRQELKEKREELAKVNQAMRESGEASESLTERGRELGTEITTLSSQIQEANKGFLDQTAVLQGQPATYQQLVEQNRALMLSMKQLPLNDTTGQLQKLQKQYVDNNNKLKSFDATLGNHQRNVGNYTGSIRLAANALAIFQGPLGPIAGRVNAFATTLDKATVSATAGSVSARLLAASMRLLWAAVLPVTVVFLALFNYFTKAEEGQQKLKVALAALRAVISTLQERSIALGKALVEMWNTPGALAAKFRETVMSVGNAIVGSLVERVSAIPEYYKGIFDQIIGTFQFLGAKVRSVLSDVPIIGDGIDADKAEKDAEEAAKRVIGGFAKSSDALAKIFNVDFIVDGVNSIVEGTKNLVKEATKNSKEAAELERRMNKVLMVERELNVERAKQVRDFQKARELARDLNEDYDVRINALKEVAAAEDDLANRLLANEKERLAVMQAQVNMFSSTTQELNALEEQRARVYELEAESAKRQISLLRDITAVERQRTEFYARQRRQNFELEQMQMELATQMEINEFEKRNMAYEAAMLRRNQIGQDSMERFNQYYNELIDQRFSEEEARRLANDRVYLEDQQELAESDYEIWKIQQANKMALMDATASLVKNSLNAVFGDNKAAAIASAIVDTYAAANKALASSPPPLSYVQAAAAIAAGLGNVRKILSTKLGSKTVTGGETGAQVANVSTSFGLVDVGTNAPIAEQVAGMASPSMRNLQPVFVFQGDLDPEMMSIKVTEGSNAISSRTLGVGI